jgi:hypothetical protein
MKYILPIIFALLLLSCESEKDKIARRQREQQERIEMQQLAEQQRVEQQRKDEADRLAAQQQAEKERIKREQRETEERRAREEQAEKERKEREIYDHYINNSLQTGATPYYKWYGGNPSCNDYGCSAIKVKTPSSSDVLVTIKRSGKVVRHAYIRAGSTYTFQMPDGTYQPFFYYGKGWNPEKVMKTNADGTVIKGGFIANEAFGKDDNPQYLQNNVLTYELILQQNGNFSTTPSNAGEAL